jgi:hypothetical protein
LKKTLFYKPFPTVYRRIIKHEEKCLRLLVPELDRFIADYDTNKYDSLNKTVAENIRKIVLYAMSRKKIFIFHKDK